MAQYTWLATATGGAWMVASNWRNVTTGANPATTAPAATDNAIVTGPTGTVFQLLLGPASGATVNLIGNSALVPGAGGAGFSFGTLTISPTLTTTATDAVDLEAGAALAAANLGVTSNLELDGAAAVAGALTEGSSGVGGEILVLNHGALDATASWTMAGGDLYVDPTASAEIGSAGGVAPGALTIDAGSTLTFSGAGTVDDAIVDNGIIAATTATAATVDGAVSGTGQIQLSASAALILDAAVTGLAAITIGSSSTLTAGVVSSVGAITIGSSGTLTASALSNDGPVSIGASGSLTVSGAVSATVAGSSSLSLAAAASATIDGTLSGLSGITMANGARLTLVAGDTNVPIALTGNDILSLDNAAGADTGVNIGGAVSGFDKTSLIQHQDFGPDFSGYQFITAATYVAGVTAGQGTLVLSSDGRTVETIALAGNYAGQQFLVNSTGLSTGNYSYSDITLAFGATTVAAGGSVTGGVANQFLLLNGTGATASLAFSGNTAVNGQFSAGTVAFNTSVSTTTDATDIEPGGSVTATSSATIGANVEVDGAGAQLIDTGLLTFGGAATNPNLEVFNGGVVRVANLLITGYNAFFGPFSNPQIVVSSQGTMELGNAGNAAVGKLTIDAGATLTNESLTGTIFANIVDNGAIVGANPATSNLYTADLYIVGNVTGNGTLTVDNNRLVEVSGDVTGLTAASVGNGATLSISGNFTLAAALATGVSSSVTVDATLSALALTVGSNGSLTAGSATIAGNAETGAAASATIDGGFSGGGGLQLDTGSTTTVGGALTGFTAATLQHNVTLTLDGSDSAVPISLAGGADSLVVSTGASVAGVISGLDATDLIVDADSSFTTSGRPVTNVVYTATGANTGTLTLFDDGQAINSFTLAGAYSQSQFLVNAVGTKDGISNVGLIDGVTTVAASGAVTGGSLEEFLQLGGGATSALSFTGNTLVTGGVTAATVKFNGGSNGVNSDATDIVGGGSIAVSGAGTIGGHVEVDGAGAALTITGAATFGGDIDNPELLVVNSGSVSLGNTLLEGSTTDTPFRPTVQLDGTATVEIGHAGGAATGSLTVDAGYSLTGGGLDVEVYGPVIDNGLIQSVTPVLSSVYVSDLQLYGPVSGTGTITVAASTSVDAYGAVSGLSQVTVGASGTFSTTGAVSGVGLISTAASATVSLGSTTALGSIQLGASSKLTVLGAAAGTGTISLANAATADFTGTVSGFASISVGANAHVTFAANDQNVAINLLGSVAGGGSTLEINPLATFGGVISGFTQGDAIEVTGAFPIIVTAATYTATSAGMGTLSLTADGTVVDTLTLAGNYAGQTFLTNNAGQPGYTNVTLAEALVPCYCRGTRIQTEHGERAVEDLAIGDRIVTVSGEIVPVVWLGWRRVDLARHPDRGSAQPVRIAADAFGPGQPRRDLLVSPEHAVFVDGVLVPARHLVGCAGIAVDTILNATTYYHIELPRHDLMFAEGLPCESWLDTGNRSMFENGDISSLTFDERRNAVDAPVAEPYAPLVTGGPVLDQIRARLGAAIAQDVLIMAPGRHAFTVPPGGGLVRLNSPVGRAAGDARPLGAALATAAVDEVPLVLGCAAFGAGFHPAEAEWVWTDGAGTLILGECPVARSLVVDVTAVAASRQVAA